MWSSLVLVAPSDGSLVFVVIDKKAKSKWDNVHTMVKAKCGLKWLLTVVGIVFNNLLSC